MRWANLFTRALRSRAAMSRSASVAVLCAVIPMAATVCAAVPEDPEGSDKAATQVLMNQGASIEDGAMPDVAIDNDVAAAESTLSATESATTQEARPVLRRRRPARLSDTTSPESLGEQSIPWYRTGFGALAIVLLLVGGAVWAAKRWIPSARTSDAQFLRVVGRTNITPRHSVALVHLGRRFFLVGVSGDRMTNLGEVSDPDEVADLTLRAGVGSKSQGDGFEELLSNEAAGYYDAGDDGVDAALPAGREKRGGLSVRRPLKDLLSRLKTLQRTDRQ